METSAKAVVIALMLAVVALAMAQGSRFASGVLARVTVAVEHAEPR